MKKTLKLTAVFVFVQVALSAQLGFAQTSGDVFPHWEADINFGLSSQGIPTRISRTALGNGGVPGKAHESRVQYTGGMYLSATLVPLRLQSLSYEFIPHISAHWYDKESGYIRGVMHKVLAGKGGLFIMAGYQNIAKMAVLNNRELTDQANGVFYQSYSQYRSNRAHLGIRIVYDQAAQHYFELGVAREQFIRPADYSATGFSFMVNHDNLKIQAEYFPKHPSRGNLFGGTAVMSELEDAAMYFQLSIRSRLWWRESW